MLGANDGIVSVAGIVMGVAGATTDDDTILVAGLAGLVAGALSMAAGEYVSVSTQRDTEQALLAKERRELAEEPEEELAELAGIYRDKGLSDELALEVARELTEHDALRAHADIELGIDPDELASPWHAAWASMVSFTVGAMLPLLTIVLLPERIRVVATVVAVALALALTGWVSAAFGDAPARPAVVRNVGRWAAGDGGDVRRRLPRRPGVQLTVRPSRPICCRRVRRRSHLPVATAASVRFAS